jgi:hypothetical protein
MFGNGAYATFPGAPGAIINMTSRRLGIVEVPMIARGCLPKGSGEQFLGEALEEVNMIPSEQLRLKGIANSQVIDIFEAGGEPAASILGEAGRKALEHLGLTPRGVGFEKVGDRLDIVIDVN